MFEKIDTQGAVLELAQRLIADKISQISPGWAIAFRIASQIATSESASPDLRQIASAVQVGAVIAAIANVSDKPKLKRRRR